MATATQQHTLEEAQAAEAAAQKKKDDAMKEYLTIPPEGKPPNQLPPDLPLEKMPETEAERKAREDEETKRAVELQKVAATQQPATQQPPKPKPDDDDDNDDNRTRSYSAPKPTTRK